MGTIHQRHRSILHKSTAICLSISFTVFNTFFGILPTPAYAEPPGREGALSRFPLVEEASNQMLPKDLDKVALPAELGKIQEVFQGTSGKTVLYVQDAHTLYDAQKSIQGLIDHFQRTYGLRLISVEGGAGEFDVTLFRAHPQPDELKEIFEDYLRKGELSGAVAAAVLNESESSFYGIDDPKLYEEGLLAYRDAQAAKPGLLHRMTKLQEVLDDQKAKVYPAELLELDRLLRNFWEEKKGLTELLQYLWSLRARLPAGREAEGRRSHPAQMASRPAGARNGRGEKRFPHLHALMKEIEREDIRGSHDGFQAEIRSFMSELRPRLIDKKDLMAFNAKHQAYETSALAPHHYAHFLLELAAKKGIKTEQYARLIRSSEHIPLILELQGPAFFSELEASIQEVKSSLFPNDEAKALDEENERLRLLTQLAKLEVTREEWEKVQRLLRRPSASLPAGRQARNDSAVIAKSAKDSVITRPRSGRSNLSPSLRFYQLAIKREKIFFRNLGSQLKKFNTGILVTGGFHVEGMTEAFRRQGISYVLIMPHMDQVPDETPYLRMMQGDVSWKKYFRVENGKVDLYEAFSRGTVARLVSAPIRPHADSLLKPWRNEIIRKLSRRREIHRAGEYTRFIDERALSPEALAMLQAKWRKRIDKFLLDLESLVKSGNVTEENLMRLFQKPAHMTPTGVQSAIPGSKLEADLIGLEKDVRKDFEDGEGVGDLTRRFEGDQALFDLPKAVLGSDGGEHSLKKGIQILDVLFYGRNTNFKPIHLALNPFQAVFNASQSHTHILETLTKYTTLAAQLSQHYGKLALRRVVGILRWLFGHARRIVESHPVVNSFFGKLIIINMQSLILLRSEVRTETPLDQVTAQTTGEFEAQVNAWVAQHKGIHEFQVGNLPSIDIAKATKDPQAPFAQDLGIILRLILWRHYSMEPPLDLELVRLDSGNNRLKIRSEVRRDGGVTMTQKPARVSNLLTQAVRSGMATWMTSLRDRTSFSRLLKRFSTRSNRSGRGVTSSSTNWNFPSSLSMIAATSLGVYPFAVAMLRTLAEALEPVNIKIRQFFYNFLILSKRPARAGVRKGEAAGWTRRDFAKTVALAFAGVAAFVGGTAASFMEEPDAPIADKEKWKGFFQGTYNEFMLNSLNGEKDVDLEKKVVEEARGVHKKLGELMSELVGLGFKETEANRDQIRDFTKRFNRSLEPLALYAHLGSNLNLNRENTFSYLIYEIAFRRKYSMVEKGKGGAPFSRNIRFLKKVSSVTANPGAYGGHEIDEDIENVFLENAEQEAADIFRFAADPTFKLSRWIYGLSGMNALESVYSLEAEASMLYQKFAHLLDKEEIAFLEQLAKDLETYQDQVLEFKKGHPDFILNVYVLPMSPVGRLGYEATVKDLDEGDKNAYRKFIDSEKVKGVYERILDTSERYVEILDKVTHAIDDPLHKIVRGAVVRDLRDHAKDMPLRQMKAARLYALGISAQEEIAQLLHELTEILDGADISWDFISWEEPLSEEEMKRFVDWHRESQAKVQVSIPDFEKRLRQANEIWKEGLPNKEAYEKTLQTLTRLHAESTAAHEFRHAYDGFKIKEAKHQDYVSSRILEALAYGTEAGYADRVPRVLLAREMLRLLKPLFGAHDGAAALVYGFHAPRFDMIVPEEKGSLAPATLAAFLKAFLKDKGKMQASVREFLNSDWIEPELLRTPVGSIEILIGETEESPAPQERDSQSAIPLIHRGLVSREPASGVVPSLVNRAAPQTQLLASAAPAVFSRAEVRSSGRLEAEVQKDLDAVREQLKENSDLANAVQFRLKIFGKSGRAYLTLFFTGLGIMGGWFILNVIQNAWFGAVTAAGWFVGAMEASLYLGDFLLVKREQRLGRKLLDLEWSRSELSRREEELQTELRLVRSQVHPRRAEVRSQAIDRQFLAREVERTVLSFLSGKTFDSKVSVTEEGIVVTLRDFAGNRLEIEIQQEGPAYAIGTSVSTLDKDRSVSAWGERPTSVKNLNGLFEVLEQKMLRDIKRHEWLLPSLEMISIQGLKEIVKSLLLDPDLISLNRQVKIPAGKPEGEEEIEITFQDALEQNKLLIEIGKERQGDYVFSHTVSAQRYDHDAIEVSMLGHVPIRAKDLKTLALQVKEALRDLKGRHAWIGRGKAKGRPVTEEGPKPFLAQRLESAIQTLQRVIDEGILMIPSPALSRIFNGILLSLEKFLEEGRRYDEVKMPFSLLLRGFADRFRALSEDDVRSLEDGIASLVVMMNDDIGLVNASLERIRQLLYLRIGWREEGKHPGMAVIRVMGEAPIFAAKAEELAEKLNRLQWHGIAPVTADEAGAISFPFNGGTYSVPFSDLADAARRRQFHEALIKALVPRSEVRAPKMDPQMETRVRKLRAVDLLWEGDNAHAYGALKHLIHQYQGVLGMRHLLPRLMSSFKNGETSSFREVAGELFILDRVWEHLSPYYDVAPLWLGIYIGFREFDIGIKIARKEGVTPPEPILEDGLYVVEAKEDESTLLRGQIDSALRSQVPFQIQNASHLLRAEIPFRGVIVAAGGSHSSEDPSHGSLLEESQVSVGQVRAYSMVVDSFDVKKDPAPNGAPQPAQLTDTQLQALARQDTSVMGLVRSILAPHFGAFPLLHPRGPEILQAHRRLQRLEVLRTRGNLREQKKQVRAKRRKAVKVVNEIEGWQAAFGRAALANPEAMKSVLEWYFEQTEISIDQLRNDLHRQYWQNIETPEDSQTAKGITQVEKPQQAWTWLKTQHDTYLQQEVARAENKRLGREKEKEMQRQRQERRQLAAADPLYLEVSGENGWVKSFEGYAAPDEAERVLRAYFQSFFDRGERKSAARKNLQRMISQEGKEKTWALLVQEVGQGRSENRLEETAFIDSLVRLVLQGETLPRSELRRLTGLDLKGWPKFSRRFQKSADFFLSDPSRILMPSAEAASSFSAADQDLMEVRSWIETDPAALFRELHRVTPELAAAEVPPIDASISPASHVRQLPEDGVELEDLARRFLQDNYWVMAYNDTNANDAKIMSRFEAVVRQVTDASREDNFRRARQRDATIPFEDLQKELPDDETRSHFFAALPAGTLRVSKLGVSAYEIDEKVLNALGLGATLSILLVIESAPARLKRMYQDHFGLIPNNRGISTVGQNFLDALAALAQSAKIASRAA